MVDLFCLLVSMGLTGLVVLRAMKLDRELEWFPKPRRQEQAKPAAKKLPDGLAVLQGPGRSPRLPPRR